MRVLREKSTRPFPPPEYPFSRIHVPSRSPIMSRPSDDRPTANDPQRTRPYTPAPNDTYASVPGGGSGDAPPPEPGCRYVLGEEIARGGMGCVLHAHDTMLGRDLAVKVLLDQHGGRPDVVARFYEEARVCGQLQHPGVVPVHDLGTLPDGRPFIAMKLVKGRTLALL